MRSSKWAILINPPVYDTQYWARWSMPHGLLKIGSWLRSKQYEPVLFDCLNPYGFKSGIGTVPPEEGYDTVRKTKRWVVKCATGGDDPEWLREIKDLPPGYKLQFNEKYRFVFGLPPEELEEQLRTFRQLREADGDLRPVEIWITSVMTYWWESTRDVITVARKVFGSDVRIRLGGIYPTLAWEHAEKSLGLARPLSIDGQDINFLDAEQQSHDLIVRRELPEASWLPLDLSLYKDEERPPYTILTTSRGCPHTCSYCAAHVLNNSGRKVVSMGQELVIEEIREKLAMGVRHFCFYEDNLLMNIHQFKDLLKRIMADNSLSGIKLYAPEGIEIAIALNDTKRWLLKTKSGTEIGAFWVRSDVAAPRAAGGNLLITLEDVAASEPAIEYEGIPTGVQVLQDSSGELIVQVGADSIHLVVEDKKITWKNQDEVKRGFVWKEVPEVLYLMRRAGFEKIYLPLETVKAKTNKRWNRAWNKVSNFDRLLEVLIDVGYSPRRQDINAFVMFGLPGEDLEEVMDTALYASARVGSVIPMLFTPVPSTPAYEEYEKFIAKHHYDLQHLNGKLFPFFEQLKEVSDARRRTPLKLEDYIRLEAFMQRLNAKVMGRSFDVLDEESRVAKTFREVFTGWRPHSAVALESESESSDLTEDAVGFE